MRSNNLIAALNWAIEKDEPLHRALKEVSGRRIRVDLPVATASFFWAIESDGLLADLGLGQSEDHRGPDVVIYIDPSASRGLRIEGDAAVAERLAPLADLLKQRLSPWEKFWNDSPFGILARQLADYAIYESALIISRPQADAHLQAVRQFRDAVDRFEKRLDQAQRTRSL
jgi:ubiquinone biosynthesis protein UbiJ